MEGLKYPFLTDTNTHPSWGIKYRIVLWSLPFNHNHALHLRFHKSLNTFKDKSVSLARQISILHVRHLFLIPQMDCGSMCEWERLKDMEVI